MSPRPGGHRHLVEDLLLVQGLPHGAGGVAGPGHEDQVGLGVEDATREGGELGGVLGHEHRLDVGAGAAQDGLDTGHVALAEGVVLREDRDLLAVEVADQRAGGGHVLVGLAARAEGVAVDAGHGVGRGGPGDVEHLVLLGLLGQRERDARGDGAGDDLGARADRVLGQADRLGGVAGVVDEVEVDLAAVDLAAAVGGVVDAGLEAVAVGLAVGGERAALGVDDRDGHRGALAVLPRRGRAAVGRAGAEAQHAHDRCCGHCQGSSSALSGRGALRHDFSFVVQPDG
nr:hypothetical protein [Nocardioides marinisabuli]